MRAVLLRLVATAFVLDGASAVQADETVRLQELFPAGYQYHVSTRVDLSGTMSLPAEKGKPVPKPLPVKGESAIEYDERVLAAGAAAIRFFPDEQNWTVESEAFRAMVSAVAGRCPLLVPAHHPPGVWPHRLPEHPQPAL